MFSKLFLTVTEIIIYSLKLIGQFNINELKMEGPTSNIEKFINKTINNYYIFII